jgi:hypothetical protein
MPKEEDLPDFTAEEAAMPYTDMESLSHFEEAKAPEPRQKSPVPASKEEALRSGVDGYDAYHTNICQTPGCKLPIKDHTIGQAENHFNKLSQAQAATLFRNFD